MATIETDGRARIAERTAAGPRPRAVLLLACAAHVVHDGFADILYVLLPIWAREFGLTLFQVGMIRSVYSGAMALFQIPAGLLAERWGERRLLALGTAITGAGFVAAGWTGGFAALLLVLLVAGLGSGVQHPLASSLVSAAYETGRRRAALGTYNFSGDLGKIAMPAAVGLAAAAVGWRVACAVSGAVGLAAAAAIFLALVRLGTGARPHADARPAGPGWGIRDARAFTALSAIGVIDSGTRTPFLTLLPFVLMSKGLTTAGVGLALALVFAGGAVGKFVCGLAAERIGVIRAVIITEIVTAAGIATVVLAPLPIGLAALAPVGAALNGTSSVLYGTVADLVSAERRSRAYGLYYTVTLGASALAPTLYGLLGDAAGVTVTLLVVASVVLLTVPLALGLRRVVGPA